jgi:hypothetical protein
MAAVLRREPLADLVPDGLRVDQHAVHVEDDGDEYLFAPGFHAARV